jgi:hypothetical protein
MPVADEVGDGEIFDGQPAVGLASWLETSWRKLRRMLAMRACSWDSERAALDRFWDPAWCGTTLGNVAVADEAVEPTAWVS